MASFSQRELRTVFISASERPSVGFVSSLVFDPVDFESQLCFSSRKPKIVQVVIIYKVSIDIVRNISENDMAMREIVN